MASKQQQLPDLPYGVGRLSAGWLVPVVILGLILAVGLYAWGGQIIYGKMMTGARDIGQMGGAAWGIYIALMLFALGVGFVGVAVVALINVFKIHQLAPLGRIAEVLSLSALVVGLLAIMADLGQPFRALGSLLQYARPQSPFYGTMLLALSYLVGVVVLIFLGGRRDAALLAQRPGRLVVPAVGQRLLRYAATAHAP
jgi:Ni/Fe-hydrogenase subunit HybB-like protein